MQKSKVLGFILFLLIGSLLSLAFGAAYTVIRLSRGNVLDLGGQTLEVHCIEGAGIISNGVLKSQSIVATGDIHLPAYSGMAITISPTVPLCHICFSGTSSNLVINASNVWSVVEISYDKTSISNVVLHGVSSKEVTQNDAGWVISARGFRVTLR